MRKILKRKLSWIRFFSLVLGFLFLQTVGYTQRGIIINLASLDGMELTPDNIFNYQIINNSGSSKEVNVKGTVRYRNSSMRFSYQFNTVISTGTNMLSKDRVNPVWDFSETGLRELFLTYKKLPQGTYEYCVAITMKGIGGETPDVIPIEDCIYQQVDDIFLINLIEPEDDAELYEYYPMFSWVVNYPFASELKYRIRVAELKEGQSKENAVTRNNPVYQDNNVFSTGIIYPVTAKPLEVWQPYVWTVDAYYKGILLGGAEVWKFMIIEDSLLKEVPRDPPFIELNIEKGTSVFYAVGELKLKYLEREQRTNNLHLTLMDEKQKPIRLADSIWAVKKGDNRNILLFHERVNLRHWKNYRLTVTTDNGDKYVVPFRYVNPLYIK